MIELHIHTNHSDGMDYHAKNKPDVKLGTGINNNMKIDKEIIQNWIMNRNLKIL